MTVTLEWPDPASLLLVSHHGSQYYGTPDGPMPRVTSVLKVLGTGTEGLIKWSASTERAACLEAAAEVFAESDHDGPAAFAAAIEARLGKVRQHQKLVDKAADIGTRAHEMIAWTLKRAMGVPCGEKPALPDQSEWAFMAWEDWWKASGLTVLRAEQPVWHCIESLDGMVGYGGTIDAIVEHPERGLGIIDIKTSKGVYDNHHLQVAAYAHAARRWAPIQWAEIVRLPKVTSDPAFEVVPLGKLYDRVVDEQALMNAFWGVLAAWKVLVAK